MNLGSYPEENQTVALKVTKLLATGKQGNISLTPTTTIDARDSYLSWLYIFYDLKIEMIYWYKLALDS